MDRPLAGTALLFRLGSDDYSEWVDQELLTRSGRTARTLIKDGPLRVTLISLSSGEGLAEHTADGPITVQVLKGDLRFRSANEEWRLGERDLLSFGAGIPHSVVSDGGCVFILTIAMSEAPPTYRE